MRDIEVGDVVDAKIKFKESEVTVEAEVVGFSSGGRPRIKVVEDNILRGTKFTIPRSQVKELLRKKEEEAENES